MQHRLMQYFITLMASQVHYQLQTLSYQVSLLVALLGVHMQSSSCGCGCCTS
jgi:predicted branched-subunit amino acid permease